MVAPRPDPKGDSLSSRNRAYNRAMAESLTGRLHGNVITLDAPVLLPEGQLVRVLIEPLEAGEIELDPEMQAKLWREWVERGPQGPIEEEEQDFP